MWFSLQTYHLLFPVIYFNVIHVRPYLRPMPAQRNRSLAGNRRQLILLNSSGYPEDSSNRALTFTCGSELGFNVFQSYFTFSIWLHPKTVLIFHAHFSYNSLLVQYCGCGFIADKNWGTLSVRIKLIDALKQTVNSRLCTLLGANVFLAVKRFCLASMRICC